MNKHMMPRQFIAWSATLLWAASCASPARIEVAPEEVVLTKPNESVMLKVDVFDGDGNRMSTRGLDISWLCEDLKPIRLSQDGVVTARTSGQTSVSVEIGGTDLRKTISVEVSLPASVHVSHEKLRLWEGEVRDDIWADVRSDKNAPIEGLMPTWQSEDPAVVRVDSIVDPNRRQSFVKLTGIKKGTTYLRARHGKMSNKIRVAVFAEDEEVIMAGDQISEKKRRDARREKARNKKEKPRQISF
ncbi:MAG: hypothetical protein QNJ97_20960 [Myxococcota bacterium]|nr:hypothetical protein [Myxococcota bacterium]